MCLAVPPPREGPRQAAGKPSLPDTQRCSPFNKSSWNPAASASDVSPVTSDDISPISPVVHEEEAAKRPSRYSKSKRLEQEYTVTDKVIGTGMSGPVFLAKGRTDGRHYAVKSFRKKGLSRTGRLDLRNEVELYLNLDHPHIAMLQRVFEDAQGLHLVMEYMEGGELQQRLAAAKKYSEEQAANTLHQMLLAIAYLHSHEIAHRDLKLENFLYERQDSDHLKLIDFGLSKHWEANTLMSQACGTIHYVAPEVLDRSYTVQADMWSAGVLAYMLLTGSPVFLGPDNELVDKIRAAKPNYSMRFRHLSSTAQSFVKALLVRDPSQRLTATQALEHPWIQGRHVGADVRLDSSILSSLRTYAHVSEARRALLRAMAWSLTSAEQEKLREQFMSMDTEKSGCISLQALKSALEKNFEVSDPEVEQLFQALDAHHSQEIEYTEFLAAAIIGQDKVEEDTLRRTFQRFDLVSQGQITGEDLRQVVGGDFNAKELGELAHEARRRIGTNVPPETHPVA